MYNIFAELKASMFGYAVDMINTYLGLVLDRQLLHW